MRAGRRVSRARLPDGAAQVIPDPGSPIPNPRSPIPDSHVPSSPDRIDGDSYTGGKTATPSGWFVRRSDYGWRDAGSPSFMRERSDQRIQWRVVASASYWIRKSTLVLRACDTLGVPSRASNPWATMRKKSIRESLLDDLLCRSALGSRQTDRKATPLTRPRTRHVNRSAV